MRKTFQSDRISKVRTLWKVNRYRKNRHFDGLTGTRTRDTLIKSQITPCR